MCWGSLSIALTLAESGVGVELLGPVVGQSGVSTTTWECQLSRTCGLLTGFGLPFVLSFALALVLWTFSFPMRFALRRSPTACLSAFQEFAPLEIGSCVVRPFNLHVPFPEK